VLGNDQAPGLLPRTINSEGVTDISNIGVFDDNLRHLVSDATSAAHRAVRRLCFTDRVNASPSRIPRRRGLRSMILSLWCLLMLSTDRPDSRLASFRSTMR